MWPEGSMRLWRERVGPVLRLLDGCVCVRASAHMHTSVYVGARGCICVCVHAFLCICGYVCLFFRCRVPVLSPPPSPGPGFLSAVPRTALWCHQSAPRPRGKAAGDAEAGGLEPGKLAFPG